MQVAVEVTNDNPTQEVQAHLHSLYSTDLKATQIINLTSMTGVFVAAFCYD